jgi:HD superfamily phosphohydrolase
MMNKHKIINDPVYGFITIPYSTVFDLIEHPYFQRLRRIKQLSLTAYVYPGALHTRFHHALGAMHLVTQAVNALRRKDVDISHAEAEAVTIAILLHDIGHGPFSHTLEYALTRNVAHESLSLLFMQAINREMGGKLDLAIEIFKGDYAKPFLHELVSSQLDMDRLDYLRRDSFFTGVQEGTIGFERIIKMLNVKNQKLVVEHKGIYSVEQFLIARRLMYWQVYLHKTVLVAEAMLVKALLRARQLLQSGVAVFATPPFAYFLQNDIQMSDFERNPDLLNCFADMDDTDIEISIKAWAKHPDKVLRILSEGILYRRLLRIELEPTAFDAESIARLKQNIAMQYEISLADADYLVFNDTTSNSAYTFKHTPIHILYKDGSVRDVAEASDYLNIAQLAHPVVKHYLCYPK